MPNFLHHWLFLNLCQILGFPAGLAVKKSACQCRSHRDSGSIPGWGRSPGGGNGNPLQYSCLESPMDCSLPGSSQRSQTRLSTEHTLGHILYSQYHFCVHSSFGLPLENQRKEWEESVSNSKLQLIKMQFCNFI